MSNAIQLPENFGEEKKQTPSVAEGEYEASVRDLFMRDGKRIHVIFVIEDEGEFKGYSLYENFSLEHPVGRRILKALLDVMGVDYGKGMLVPEICKGKRLRVTVQHKAGKDGMVWANVVGHRATARQKTKSGKDQDNSVNSQLTAR